jgi:hypothetical protein
MLEKMISPTDQPTGPQEHLGGYVVVQHRNHNWNLLGFCETEQDARSLAKSHAVGMNAGNIIILPTLGWYTAGG